MSMQQSINAAISSIASSKFMKKTSSEFGEIKRAYKKQEKQLVKEAKEDPKKMSEQMELAKSMPVLTTTKTQINPNISEDWSQVVAPKNLTPQEKAVANLNQNLANKAEQKAAVEERKEILKDPEAAGEKIAKEQMNAMATAAPQEKKEEEKAKEPEKKEETPAAEKKEEEAVKVRKTEISASEAKKLIAETEAREKLKKELEEKAKQALEGGNK